MLPKLKNPARLAKLVSISASIVILTISITLSAYNSLIHAQAGNPWNIQRNTSTNDLDFWLNTNGLSGANMQLRSNGSTRVRSLYDLDDASNTYFLDPASTSNLNILTVAGSSTLNGNLSLPTNGSVIYLPEISGNTSYTGIEANNGLMSDGVPWYGGFGREPGGWSFPFPDYVISNHTGLRLAAHGGYGGVSIYDQLNAAGTAWSSAGYEVARFRDNRWGGSLLNTNLTIPQDGTLITMPEISGNTSYTGFASNGQPNMADGIPYYWGIGREPGGWSSPFPDLVINHHTGLRLAAHSGYGGISFYEELNPPQTAWSSTGNEIARFRDDRWGLGSYFNGLLRINESSNPIQINADHTGYVNLASNRAEIANDTNAYKTLMLLGNSSAGLGRRVSVWDRFEVNGTFVNNSSEQWKKDIQELSTADYDDILKKINDTSLFHYRFKQEGIDQKQRLGVIAEKSPVDILDETGKSVSILDYLGFLFAGLKAHNFELEELKKANKELQETLKQQQTQIQKLQEQIDRLNKD